MRAATFLALGLVWPCALAGCGSTYTKEDFIARADAICAGAVRGTLAVPPPTFGGTTAQQLAGLAKYLETVLLIYQSEAAQLRALRRPEQSARDQAELTRFLRAISQASADFRALTESGKRGDPQGVASAEAALRANPVGSLATSYGLKSCGTPSATVS